MREEEGWSKGKIRDGISPPVTSYSYFLSEAVRVGPFLQADFGPLSPFPVPGVMDDIAFVA